MVMDKPFPISEYRDRLEAAVAELTKQSFEAHRSADERARLAAKAEGVALALSYWGEHEPAPAPAGGDHGQVTLTTYCPACWASIEAPEPARADRGDRA